MFPKRFGACKSRDIWSAAPVVDVDRANVNPKFDVTYDEHLLRARPILTLHLLILIKLSYAYSRGARFW